MVRIENVALHFDDGKTTALNGISTSVDAGEFVAIVGPSGCGKSSLLNVIGTLERPTTGEVYYQSQPYSDIADASLFRRQHFGFIFQSFHLIPTLSALDNVVVATIGCPGPAREHTQRARQLLAQLGLRDRIDHFPRTMSGGERQRVAIARALINNPDLILADEPTGSLDSVSTEQVLDVISEIRQQRGITIVVVTHDPEVSGRADRVVSMRDGKIEPGTEYRQ
jgi:putative ABC transport system ATP-binding protein